jgi:hypothetical protein
MKNIVHFVSDLQDWRIDTKMCSFDVFNMYTNIPTKRFTTIIQAILNNQNTQQNTIEEI